MCKRSSLAPPVPARQIYSVAGAGTSDRSAPRPAVARAMRFVQSVRLYFRAISPRLVIDPVVKVRRCDATDQPMRPVCVSVTTAHAPPPDAGATIMATMLDGVGLTCTRLRGE